VTHPQKPFLISTKTFKSTAFAKTAAALAAVTWALKHNQTPARVTLTTGSSTIFHAVMTSKVIACHASKCTVTQLYAAWF